MDGSHQPRRPGPANQRRFTLRTLFVASAAIAVPFLLLANLRSAARPDDSLASPLYIALGVASVFVAAAIGSALAERTGAIATASAASLVWILLVAQLSQFSSMLSRQLPVHVVAAVATVAALAVVLRRRIESTDDKLHEHLVQLIDVKRQVQEASAAEHSKKAAATAASQQLDSSAATKAV